MGDREIDNVVFDIGGVLLDWDPRHLYRRLFDDHDEMADFLATVCTSDWHRAHDLGVDTLQSCQELAREHPRYADMIMAWSDRGEEMIAGQIEGTVEVLAEVRAAPDSPGYPTGEHSVLQCLHVLLNEEWEHHRYTVRDLDILDPTGAPGS